ncbi:LysR family substrate-binding domain-containing protein [Saccharothrix texasensis]|uniref:LysR family substrate-binding domain-containing protein n=1 Tax=Saccharothrix texasensis TaxID=103734 RepID=UPI000F4C3C31
MVGSSVLPPLPRIIRVAGRATPPSLSFSVPQVELLRTAALDVGLLRPAAARSGRRPGAGAVSREPLVAVAPDDHRLARRRRVHVRSPAGEPFVLFPRHLGPGLHDEITAPCRRGGFTPEVAQEAVRVPTIVGLVAAGCGVSVVPGSAAAQPRPEVVFLPLSPRSGWSTWRSRCPSPAGPRWPPTSPPWPATSRECAESRSGRSRGSPGRQESRAARSGVDGSPATSRDRQVDPVLSPRASCTCAPSRPGSCARSGSARRSCRAPRTAASR